MAEEYEWIEEMLPCLKTLVILAERCHKVFFGNNMRGKNGPHKRE